VCIEQIDYRLLNRAGLALRALAHWRLGNPTDDTPSNGQLRDQLRSLDGLEVDERTIRRGINDLAAAGLVTIETLRHHPVGRRIQMEPPPDRSVPPDSNPRTDLSGLTLNVIELNSKSTYYVRPDSSVRGGGQNCPPPDRTVRRVEPYTDPETIPPASPIGRVFERLALAIGGGDEVQGKLPLTGGTPRPRDKGTELRLTQVLGRLEIPDDGTNQRWAIGRLKGEYGASYEPFYRKVAEAVRVGREPVGKLLDAVEEAGREGVKNRGAAFVAACKRTMKTLGREAGTPDPGPYRQAHPGSGENPIVPESTNLAHRTG